MSRIDPIADRAFRDDIRARLADPRRVARLLSLDKGAIGQAGGGLTVLCPAHGDKNPSCSLSPGRDKTLRVNCFSCGLAGDVFTLVAAVEGLDVDADFRAVKQRAAELAGVVQGAEEGEHRAPPPPPSPPDPPPLADDVFAAIVAPLAHVGILDDSPIAADVTEYLAGRGLLDEARRAGVFALPPPGGAQVMWIKMLTDVFGADVLERSGLVHGDTFTRAGHRLCIPIRDAEGHVYTLKRRALDGRKDKYRVPKGRPIRLPYGVEALSSAPADAPVAFVEGELDVLAMRALCREAGVVRVVLGVPGVDTWDPPWALYARGRVALVALDADAAGERKAAAVAADLRAAGAVDVRRVRPANGAKDWAATLEVSS